MEQSKKVMFSLCMILILSLSFIYGCTTAPGGILQPPRPKASDLSDGKLESFSTCSALKAEFEKAKVDGRDGGISLEDAAPQIAFAKDTSSLVSADFSETNVQVQGVDEADIVKTDGNYIYTISNNKLVIARAFPEERAEILSQLEIKDLSPTEMFIEGDRLLVFGSSSYEVTNRDYDERVAQYYPVSMFVTSIKSYDISDKENPGLVREVDFEGGYVTSRKINDLVYFVINSYPRYYEISDDIIPMYRENTGDFAPSVGCGDVKYFEPLRVDNFITVASINILDENSEIEKEVILGSGQNVYASLENLYVAEVDYSYNYKGYPEIDQEIPREKTIIYKFSLDDGEIIYTESGSVPGRILNQFSMDEHEGYFRIATTLGDSFDSEHKSGNNVYVLDNDLDIVGSEEDLAPGESIYSTRFMGDRLYMVTFKKVDPLFVIDLSNPRDPEVLGKLKIPGFSNYLHPYDEDHIIGIGKDTVEAEEVLKETRNIDFAWYQGLKIAIFDVSDVENPKQMHVELIGDRGTDSDVLYDHKAFLFDREKNLMVLPISLAEINKNSYNGEIPAEAYGEFVFQGAYVYDVDLVNGFRLKGRVTHFDDDEVFKKSGYYYGGGNYNVKRALYIGDVLYTISNGKIKLNYLDDLKEIKELKINVVERDYPIYALE